MHELVILRGVTLVNPWFSKHTFKTDYRLTNNMLLDGYPGQRVGGQPLWTPPPDLLLIVFLSILIMTREKLLHFLLGSLFYLLCRGSYMSISVRVDLNWHGYVPVSMFTRSSCVSSFPFSSFLWVMVCVWSPILRVIVTYKRAKPK